MLLPMAPARSAPSDGMPLNDAPLSEEIVLPNWFKLSFLELRDDVADAAKHGKRGLIIFFSRKDCPYCKALLDHDWGNPDIVAYTRKYFDVVAIDVKGDRQVTDVDGSVYTEQQFAAFENANFTPTLVFYDTHDKQVFRLAGYHQPYTFQAALEYVVSQDYRNEDFRHYLARGEKAPAYGHNKLNSDPAFSPPPYALDRSHFSAGQPLVVFFERPRCYACDVLHAETLATPKIRRLLKGFDAVQLNMQANTPVITPAGRRLTARGWAEKLGLFYAPTLVFFDQHGKEIIRVDSVVRFHRLAGVLRYVADGGYRKQPNFQLWREARGAQ